MSELAFLFVLLGGSFAIGWFWPVRWFGLTLWWLVLSFVILAFFTWSYAWIVSSIYMWLVE